MKYITTLRLAPGVKNVKRAFEVFGRVGNAAGMHALYAGIDGKTFITIIETDDPDMVTAATYAPFFESVTVVPVVDVDDAWMNNMAAAIENLDT
jgi:hypothetical protein